MFSFFFSVIRINLLDSNLKQETKYFTRIKNALNNFTSINLKFIWNPPTLDICPSSIAKYFNDIGYKIELKQTQIKIHQEYNWKSLKFLLNDFNNDNELQNDFIESIGMCMLSCDMNPDDYINSYEPNILFEEIKHTLILHCKGFFLSNFITDIINEIR